VQTRKGQSQASQPSAGRPKKDKPAADTQNPDSTPVEIPEDELKEMLDVEDSG
jgi:hypothetical protein